MPWLVQVLGERFRHGNRLLWGGLTVILCLLPAAYGATTLADKSLWRFADQQNLVGLNGVRLDLLGPDGNAVDFHHEMQTLAATGSLLYYTSPDLALATSNSPFLVTHADFIDVAELAATVYAGCPAGGISLVLPEHFSANGKAAAIMDSFVDATEWTQRPLASASHWIVWHADCAAER